ncbi:molybdenum cofactor biosynthesis protein MoaE, partial [Mycobacterium sp. ITM-2017-0098]
MTVVVRDEVLVFGRVDGLIGECGAHEAAGAVVAFAGVVRDHDGGRGVTRLEYSAHPSAAQTLADV